jgi:hypothetical protein
LRERTSCSLALATAERTTFSIIPLARCLETQQRDRVIHVAAADQVHQQPRLARRDACESMFGLKWHINSNERLGIPPAPAPPGAPGAVALRPLWPRKIRVGENSPSLWPTMSSCTNTFRNLFPL